MRAFQFVPVRKKDWNWPIRTKHFLDTMLLLVKVKLTIPGSVVPLVFCPIHWIGISIERDCKKGSLDYPGPHPLATLSCEDIFPRCQHLLGEVGARTRKFFVSLYLFKQGCLAQQWKNESFFLYNQSYILYNHTICGLHIAEATTKEKGPLDSSNFL